MNNRMGIEPMNRISLPIAGQIRVSGLIPFPLGALFPFRLEVKGISKKNPDKAFFPYRG